jgi:hypothetical protein
MGKQLVAAIDGVMVKAGGQLRPLYKDGAVPEGADQEHVKLLVDRGLLVEKSDDADSDTDTDVPAKSANKDVWVDYAVSQGADRAEAEAATKDDLIASYGG